MAGERELFAFLEDLEAQAEAAWDAERRVDLDDRSRAEYREVTLAARVTASVGRPLEVDVRGVGQVRGELARVGDGWFLLRSPRQDWVVRTAAVTRLVGASERAVPVAAWSPLQRLGIGSVLRRIADEGARCLLHLRDGRRHEAERLVRVGADFVEVLEGEVVAGEGRLVLVTLDGLAAVQSPDPDR
ncbi:hypothetical protein GCM10009737_28850 [Nocardioides lentus]|uniref:Uncharacterized protein n=1 Tax=Nocardioides lentus TaxID=338077 RepID=A0ABN2PMT4_9ACTN